jgi:ferric-dicitrate binding protein FerR (iron transport regulator)
MNPYDPEDELATAIVRVLSGDLTEREEVALRHWIDADPTRRRLFEEMSAVWDAASAAHDGWDTAKLRKRIAAAREKIAVLEQVSSASGASAEQGGAITARRLQVRPRPRMTRRVSGRLLGLAASITVLIASGAVTWWTTLGRVESAVVATPSMREVATARGEQATLDLADGSRVILAADSKLRIPVDYNKQSQNGSRRELELEGKAYFEVVHDRARPFVVRTATAVTEDLGTEFVIQAYPETRATQVVVATGSVAVRRPWQMTDRATARSREPDSSKKPLIVLTPGSLGRLDSDGTATLARNVSVDEYVSWTKGILVFASTPLDQAVLELNRWYDVDIRLATPALARRRITALLRNEPFDVALRRLTMTLGVDARRSGGTITLVPR